MGSPLQPVEHDCNRPSNLRLVQRSRLPLPPRRSLTSAEPIGWRFLTRRAASARESGLTRRRMGKRVGLYQTWGSRTRSSASGASTSWSWRTWPRSTEAAGSGSRPIGQVAGPPLARMPPSSDVCEGVVSLVSFVEGIVLPSLNDPRRVDRGPLGSDGLRDFVAPRGNGENLSLVAALLDQLAVA